MNDFKFYCVILIDWCLAQLSLETLYPPTDEFRCKGSQIRIGESFEIAGGRIKGARGIKGSTRKPIELTKLGSEGLMTYMGLT